LSALNDALWSAMTWLNCCNDPRRTAYVDSFGASECEYVGRCDDMSGKGLGGR
jgi:hypothetical protein